MRKSLLGTFGTLCAAALLVGAPAAAQDLEWEAADGSFPDHGGCVYFGPSEGRASFRSEADDFAAMRLRTQQTNRALLAIPQPRRAAAVVPSRRPVPRAAASAPGCTGIDDCVQKTAAAAGLPLADLTTDLEFLRRVRLDLTGRIPTRDEVLAFAADGSADKREKLVDRLLQTSEWADRWTMFFGDLYRNTSRTPMVNRYPNGRDSLHLFLLESMRANKPYDQMAREMLAAQGTSDGRTYPDRYTDYEHFQSTYGDYRANPVRPSAVSYVVGGRTIGGPIQDTYDTLAFITARDFLGINVMDCVLCHDGAGHLEAVSVWGTHAKRLEAWGLAAFFADVPRYQAWRTPGRLLPNRPDGRRVNANYYFVNDLAIGQHQRTRAGDTAGDYLAQTEGGNRPDRLHAEQFVKPLYPFEARAAATGTRLRVQLGEQLTSDPQFARAAVNYIWREFFSRAIVEPPDQFDLARLDPGSPPTNGWEVQPSHPELLELLAASFRDNGFDLKWLMREIVTSQTYQLSSRYEGAFNPLDERYFIRHQVKRLTAEQMHDALVVAGGLDVVYNVSRAIRGLRFAMQFPDVRDMPTGNRPAPRNVRVFLQSFTPGDREETARSREGSPLQALNLMNNPFALDRLGYSSPNGTLGQALELPDDALVAHLYLSALSRRPTPEELQFAVDYVQGGSRQPRAANLLWALFNKTDFYFNY